MKRPEADWRELAKAVDRVRRVDAGIDQAVHELRQTSQRQLIATSAALGLGLAAIATLTAAGKKSRDGRPPVRASTRHSILGGLVVTLAPWAFDAAVRRLSSRPAGATAGSARNRSGSDHRDQMKLATEGDPQ
jgi:hypothetical protein